MDDADANDRPLIELFVKAAVDKMRNGGCPTCHRYFLLLYILRDRGFVDLIVTTFLPESPPKEVLEFSNGKIYPLVKVRSGLDSRGQNISGLECSHTDEIDALLNRFDCDEMKATAAERDAELSFLDLYSKFSHFLKVGAATAEQLAKALEKVDHHLKESGTRFMVSDTLCRADCNLLPTLQHIRVAGKAYKNFEIPTELRRIWRYLKNAYTTDAFLESCPADREIITHYSGKTDVRIPASKSHLMGDDRTLSVPDEAARDFDDDDY